MNKAFANIAQKILAKKAAAAVPEEAEDDLDLLDDDYTDDMDMDLDEPTTSVRSSKAILDRIFSAK